MQFGFSISKEEVYDYIGSREDFLIRSFEEEDIDSDSILRQILNSENIVVTATAIHGNDNLHFTETGLYLGENGHKLLSAGLTSVARVSLKSGLTHPKHFQNLEQNNRAKQEVFDEILLGRFRSSLYCFRAERTNLHSSAFGNSRILKPDANNLAEVLHNLQSNSVKFSKFNKYVHRVLPQVTKVSVRNISGQTPLVQVLVWSDDIDSEREDLAVPLSESGTGIGQFLAILYVVLTEQNPKVIIIDEPNSFLHPGAIRNLVEILRENPQHQYILTTHSPIVVTAANPETLTLIEREGFESKFTQINQTSNNDLRKVLDSVGARLSDVFGADYILWVEGPTEAKCFPMILEAMSHKRLYGTIIQPVRHTGDFEGRNSVDAFSVYTKLSQGTAMLPSAVGFIFDRENRTDVQIMEMERKASLSQHGVENPKLRFLSRRLYENYLLEPKAIADLLTHRDNGVVHSEESVSQFINDWIERNQNSRKYGGAIGKLDAAKLLQELFSKLSEYRVEYNKVSDSPALTECLLKTDPSRFEEIANLLNELLASDRYDVISYSHPRSD